MRTFERARLLIEEAAIRHAAGNPNGTVPLALPVLQRIKDVPDPKALLRDLLRTASEMCGRRLKRFNDNQCVRRVADQMREFDQLRVLSALRRLETDLQATVDRLIAEDERPQSNVAADTCGAADTSGQEKRVVGRVPCSSVQNRDISR